MRPIITDPDIGFGQPTIAGIRVEIIQERKVAGDTILDLIRDYELTGDEVRAALDYKLEHDEAGA